MQTNPPTFPSMPSIHIVGVEFTPMPAHQQQYRRSITTRVDEPTLEKLNLVRDRCKSMLVDFEQQSTFQHEHRQQAQYLASLSREFATLEAEAVPVILYAANGKSWDAEVASFVIEVDVDFPGFSPDRSVKYYVAGYTDRPVPTDGSPIDPQTRLFINSVFDYRRLVERRQGVEVVEHYELVNASQMFVNYDFDGSYDNADSVLHRARPFDVVIAATAAQDPLIKNSGMSIVDTRLIQGTVPVFADYTLNDPGRWAEKLVYGYQHIDNFPTVIPHFMQFYHSVARVVRDVDVRMNAFMKVLAHCTDGILAGEFRFQDLTMIDEGFVKKMRFNKKPELIQSVLFTSLEGSDATTVTAHHVSNSVPALMARYGVRSVTFSMQNLDNAEFNTKVLDCVGISNNVDNDVIQAFCNDVKYRVFNAITHDQQIPCLLSGRFDLFGSSQFSLKLAATGELHHYSSPTFANALFSPQLVPSLAKIQALGESLVQLYQSFDAKEEMGGDVEDANLSPEELDAKYNPEGEGEHPLITREMWRAAVEQQETISGYWVWVAHILKE